MTVYTKLFVRNLQSCHEASKWLHRALQNQAPFAITSTSEQIYELALLPLLGIECLDHRQISDPQQRLLRSADSTTMRSKELVFVRYRFYYLV